MVTLLPFPLNVSHQISGIGNDLKIQHWDLRNTIYIQFVMRGGGGEGWVCSFENADKHSSDFSVHIFDATLGGMQHERVTVGNQ